MHQYQPDIRCDGCDQCSGRLCHPHPPTSLDVEAAVEAETEDWCFAYLCHWLLVSYCCYRTRSESANFSSACITSVMRLVESIRSLNNPNISISLVPVSLWAAAEVSAGLVVCCLPLLPRFFGRKNVRTRLQVSEPTEFSGLNSKDTSATHGTEYEDSLRSNVSVPGRVQRGRFIIMKNVTLDQTSTHV
jgi:hypothetical protein